MFAGQKCLEMFDKVIRRDIVHTVQLFFGDGIRNIHGLAPFPEVDMNGHAAALAHRFCYGFGEQFPVGCHVAFCEQRADVMNVVRCDQIGVQIPVVIGCMTADLAGGWVDIHVGRVSL